MINKNEAPVIEPKDVFIGHPDAPITITEFADYETESAAEAHEVVKAILKKYNGKVKFNFRHFPLLRIHQKAHKAAEAAIAAAQEGKFLEMHEMLLNNRRNLGTISLKLYAKDIGSTNKHFLSELINGKYGWYVQDDLKEGIDRGVREIPAFFVNNKKIDGLVTAKKLKTEIEAAFNQIGS